MGAPSGSCVASTWSHRGLTASREELGYSVGLRSLRSLVFVPLPRASRPETSLPLLH